MVDVKIKPEVSFRREVLHNKIDLSRSLFSFGLWSPVLRGQDPLSNNLWRTAVTNEK